MVTDHKKIFSLALSAALSTTVVVSTTSPSNADPAETTATNCTPSVPKATAAIVQNDIATNKTVVVEGKGWCAEPGHGVSEIAVKYNAGAWTRVDNTVYPDNLGVWRILNKEINPKTGDFRVTLHIPDGTSNPPYGSNPVFHNGRLDIALLTGSLKQHDISRVVILPLSVGPYTPDISPHIIVPDPHLLDKVTVIPDAPGKLKIYIPSATPGDWVYAYAYVPQDSGKFGCDSRGWNPLITKNAAERFKQVGPDRTVTYDVHFQPGQASGTVYKFPYGRYMIGLFDANKAPESEYGHPIGFTWLYNTSIPPTSDTSYSPELHPGYGWGVLPKNWIEQASTFAGYRTCTPELPIPHKPVVEAPTPLLTGDREITIPETPLVIYKHDNKIISGTINVSGNEATSYVISVEPAPGFSLLGGSRDFIVKVPERQQPSTVQSTVTATETLQVTETLNNTVTRTVTPVVQEPSNTRPSPGSSEPTSSSPFTKPFAILASVLGIIGVIIAALVPSPLKALLLR